MTKKELSTYKKIPDNQIQDFLAFKRRGSKVPSKKGRGSYNRHRFKEEIKNEDSSQ